MTENERLKSLRYWRGIDAIKQCPHPWLRLWRAYWFCRRWGGGLRDAVRLAMVGFADK